MILKQTNILKKKYKEITKFQKIIFKRKKIHNKVLIVKPYKK